MKRLLCIISAALFVSVLLAASVSAEVPHLIRFQGKVTDTNGAPLNGAYNITFRVYNSESGGTLLWSETQTAVPVNNGIFTVLLGNVASLDLPFDEAYWLSMEVNNDGEMAPRQAITSVGYAIHAEVADSIANVSVVPQGAVIIWLGTSCPEGYTRVVALDGKFIVGGATYNAAAGGSNTQTHGAGSYSVPSHTHSISDVSRGIGWNAQHEHGGVGDTNASVSTDVNNLSAQSGGGAAVTGTSGSADNRPEFATVIFCQKN